MAHFNGQQWEYMQQKASSDHSCLTLAVLGENFPLLLVYLLKWRGKVRYVTSTKVPWSYFIPLHIHIWGLHGFGGLGAWASWELRAHLNGTKRIQPFSCLKKKKMCVKNAFEKINAALSKDEPRSHDVLNGLAGYLSALLFVRANTREWVEQCVCSFSRAVLRIRTSSKLLPRRICPARVVRICPRPMDSLCIQWRGTTRVNCQG